MTEKKPVKDNEAAPDKDSTDNRKPSGVPVYECATIRLLSFNRKRAAKGLTDPNKRPANLPKIAPYIPDDPKED